MAHGFVSGRSLKEVWGVEGLWDPVAMLPGVDPGQLDPYVHPVNLAREGWRAVVDAEGVLLALVPPSTEYDEDWPEKFVEFLNAAESATGRE